MDDDQRAALEGWYGDAVEQGLDPEWASDEESFTVQCPQCKGTDAEHRMQISAAAMQVPESIAEAMGAIKLPPIEELLRTLGILKGPSSPKDAFSEAETLLRVGSTMKPADWASMLDELYPLPGGYEDLALPVRIMMLARRRDLDGDQKVIIGYLAGRIMERDHGHASKHDKPDEA
jgi:hypothetical protein